MTASTAELLRPGRVVRMRNRLWRVDNVLDDEFHATPIDGRDAFARRFLSDLELLAEGAIAAPDPGKASDPAEHDLAPRGLLDCDAALGAGSY